MNTRREQDREKADEPRPGDLKASDFFPPGVGWNQSAEEEDRLREDEARKERERH